MKSQQIALMRNGHTDAHIARMFGLDPSTISKLRTACGIPQNHARMCGNAKVIRGSLAEAILDTLAEVRPLPVATADLVALCGARTARPRTNTWAALQRLTKAGLVEQTGKFPSERGGYIVYWRATEKAP